MTVVAHSLSTRLVSKLTPFSNAVCGTIGSSQAFSTRSPVTPSIIPKLADNCCLFVKLRESRRILETPSMFAIERPITREDVGDPENGNSTDQADNTSVSLGWTTMISLLGMNAALAIRSSSAAFSTAARRVSSSITAARARATRVSSITTVGASGSVFVGTVAISTSLPSNTPSENASPTPIAAITAADASSMPTLDLHSFAGELALSALSTAVGAVFSDNSCGEYPSFATLKAGNTRLCFVASSRAAPKLIRTGRRLVSIRMLFGEIPGCKMS